MAGRNVTGQIARVSKKDGFTDRQGNPVTLYSFQLEGSNQWFRTGSIAPNVGVGQNVKFVADGANVDMATLASTQATVQAAPSPSSAAPVAATPSRAASQSRNAGSKDDYWAAKEARDVEKDARYQAVSEPRMALSVAVEAASRIIPAALANDGLSFGKATKAQKLGVIASYTKELALELAVFIQDAPAQLAAYKATQPATPVAQTTDEVTE